MDHLSLNLLDTFTDYFVRCQNAGNLRKDLNPKHCVYLFNNIIQSLPGQINNMESGIGLFVSMDVEFAIEVMNAQVDI